MSIIHQNRRMLILFGAWYRFWSMDDGLSATMASEMNKIYINKEIVYLDRRHSGFWGARSLKNNIDFCS